MEVEEDSGERMVVGGSGRLCRLVDGPGEPLCCPRLLGAVAPLSGASFFYPLRIVVRHRNG